MSTKIKWFKKASDDETLDRLISQALREHEYSVLADYLMEQGDSLGEEFAHPDYFKDRYSALLRLQNRDMVEMIDEDYFRGTMRYQGLYVSWEIFLIPTVWEHYIALSGCCLGTDVLGPFKVRREVEQEIDTYIEREEHLHDQDDEEHEYGWDY